MRSGGKGHDRLHRVSIYRDFVGVVDGQETIRPPLHFILKTPWCRRPTAVGMETVEVDATNAAEGDGHSNLREKEVAGIVGVGNVGIPQHGAVRALRVVRVHMEVGKLSQLCVITWEDSGIRVR